MKGVVELGSKAAEEESGISNCQVLQFERDSIAEFDIFSACWRLSVESLPKDILTVRQLCLIFQAYCLIFPVHCESISTAEQLQSQKFIVPCKLPFTFEDMEQVTKVAESTFATFYFDFHDFLPDEVYHRLICLAWKNSKGQEEGNRLSKRSCFFVSLNETNWLIQHEYQRLKVMVL